MAKTKAQRFAEIHSRALAGFTAAWQASREERLNALSDRRFYSIAGAQWEGSLGEQFENLPKFEVNKIALSVIRIFNEYRNNRIAAIFRPKDTATSADDAELLNGLYRADQADSGAQEAKDNCFEEGVGGGFGAYRLRNEREVEDEDDGDEDGEQRIKWEPIYDADTSVFFDLGAKRYDKADAVKAWVLVSMTKEGYEEAYPNNPLPSSWPKPTNEYSFDWFRPAVVYIAEYYEVQSKATVRHVYQLDLGGDQEPQEKSFLAEDLDEDTIAELTALGWTEARQEKVKRKRVHKYIMNGAEIIEDCGLIAGPNIPIVPFYGKRWFVENVERFAGHVRTSKDAQRLKNMQVSRLGQIAALSPVEKPIFDPEQIKGFEQRWADDNIQQYPFLVARALRDANGTPVAVGPQSYTKPPSIPPALAALLQATEQDMQDMLGNQQAGEQLQANVSAKAVELVQNKLDMQTFIYMDNMAKTEARAAEIWRGMAKEIYVEEGREMRTADEQGGVGFKTIMQPGVDSKTGATITQNDLSKGRFDVITDVGPSYASRRDSTVRALTGVLAVTQDPELQKLLTSTIMMNMDGEGLKDLNAYMRKRLVQQGVITPTDAEAEEMAQEAQQQQPDPQAQYLMASANAANATAENKHADTGLKHAQTLKTLAEANAPASAVGLTQ